jgi:hypothetical protein
MSRPRSLHIVHLLIRRERDGHVEFLVYPHDKWKDKGGHAYLTLPTKKTVSDPLAPFLEGTSIEAFVDVIATQDLGLEREDYAIELEIEPARKTMDSPTTGQTTQYTIYPIDLWVKPGEREGLCGRLNGTWFTCEQGEAHAEISPTAKAVFEHIREREAKIHDLLKTQPSKPLPTPAAPVPGQLLLDRVLEQASMDALALRWLAKNRAGVRIVDKKTIGEVLQAGTRAFNLRVADPYLRYQMQGTGFTWSFFTHKDKQDCHVHGAPVVEIYGILEGRMEIWWKPYYERGTSAWAHRVLDAGDWAEVDSLQCHIAHWLSEGKGVVFKAGPGPLAEVGKLGVKGKTPCADCPCMKPPQVYALEGKAI